ncbi:MAG: hypothetical protein K9G46_03465 [Flavobacteriales bacterium]|jgi:hypothetical protein|nr:hypothetical protein [Flavobacteriales bacterium]
MIGKNDRSNLMAKSTTFFLFSFFFFLNASAQETLQIHFFNPTSENWLLLTKDRKFIADNDSLNEELVNLVKAFSVDSVLPSKSQRHRVAAAGWVISVFGYKWKALNMTKQKFVGTERDHISMPSPPHFTEYDVNFNLIPHTRKYIDLVWIGHEKQAKRNRWNRIKNLDEAPWIYPETLENINRYRMHCEITPPVYARAMLNEKFYPCISPNSSKEHHNIGADHGTFGMYGPYVADFNHSGHPEIHPYEWLWWYDTHPDRLQEKCQTWYFGFMKEASNRFRGWYKKKEARVGQISVPFVFDLSNDTLKITLEHLVHDLFNSEGLTKLESVPDNASNLYFSERNYAFESGELNAKTIQFTTSNPIKKDGLKTWFSELNLDREANVLSGYLNIGVSVNQLYNAKISFE